MSCGVGHRYGLDLALPWLWHSLAALAPIRPLAWEPPHARGVALKKKKKKKKYVKLEPTYIADGNGKRCSLFGEQFFKKLNIVII